MYRSFKGVLLSIYIGLILIGRELFIILIYRLNLEYLCF